MPVPTYGPLKLRAEPGNYAGQYFVKLTWAPPEGHSTTDGTYWYNIYRKIVGAVSYDLIASSSQGNTVYYDTLSYNDVNDGHRLSPNTNYEYLVRCINLSGVSGLTGPTTTVVSPNFPPESNIYQNTSGWILKCGMLIDATPIQITGRPAFVVVSYGTLPSGTPITEFRESGGQWIKIPSVYTVPRANIFTDPLIANIGTGSFSVGPGYVCYITYRNSTLDFNTKYEIRMTIRNSDGDILNQTNTVAITTYSNGPESFPNILPNGDFKHEYYNTKNGIVVENGLPTYNDDSVGTWQPFGTGYDTIHLHTATEILTSPITFVHTSYDGTDVEFTTKFYSGRALHINYPYFAGVGMDKLYFKNLAAINLPPPMVRTYANDLTNVRRYAVACRVTEDYRERIDLTPVSYSHTFYCENAGGFTSNKCGYVYNLDDNPHQLAGSDNMFAKWSYESGPPNDRQYRMFIKWDLSEFHPTPNKTLVIDSATVSLYCINGLGYNTRTFYRVQSDWEESTLKWTSSANSLAIELPNSSFTLGYAGWRDSAASTDFTHLVSGWIGGTTDNYGIMFRTNETQPDHYSMGGDYVTKYDPLALYPKLTIEYHYEEVVPYGSTLTVERSSGPNNPTTHTVIFDKAGRPTDEKNTLTTNGEAILLVNCFSDTYELHNQTSQPFLLLKAIPYENSNYVDYYCSIYAGDFMMFDLTAVFGGNGGDIVDTSMIVYIQDWIKAILESSSYKWWEFDYVSNAPGIPYPIYGEDTTHATPDVDGAIVTMGLINVDDDYGGMDTTGCLPERSYAVQYIKTGNDFANEKSPITMSNQDPYINVVLGTADTDSPLRLEPYSDYRATYSYINSAGVVGISEAPSDFSTAPTPGKVQNVVLHRNYPGYYDDNPSYLYITWDRADTTGFPAPYWTQGYEIWYAHDEPTSFSKLYDSPGDGDHSYQVMVVNDRTYFIKIRAYNIVNGNLNYGDFSDTVSIVTVSLPTEPTNVGHVFTNINGISTNIIYTWEPPVDDGCSYTGTEGITGYYLIHGPDVDNMYEESLGPYDRTFSTQSGPHAYSINVGSTAYFKIAAITSHSTPTVGITTPLGGMFSDLQEVKFMTMNETVKIRGTASTAGYLDFIFTARTNDGTYLQYENAFWRLTDNKNAISTGATISNIEALLADPDVNVFKNGITDNAHKGWPKGANKPVATLIGDNPVVGQATDILGPCLNIEFTLQPATDVSPTDNTNVTTPYIWDIHCQTSAAPDGVSEIGLNGMGAFMVITDFTTDISFYNAVKTRTQDSWVDFPQAINGLNTGSLVWTINAAIVYNPYKSSSENTPQITQEFSIPVLPDQSLVDIENRINGVGGTGLQDQINDYFLNNAPPGWTALYSSYDPTTPFTVTTEIVTGTAYTKPHLQVNIRTMVEHVQHQISCRAVNLNAFYLATRANCYYVSNMLYELRSYEDMYGRNKPGSSPIPSSGYVKRSYGFRFNLDYITDYEEEEMATLDLTPIPGTSSSNTIGLDVIGTVRTVTISGVRVDNSNEWLFHAPFEYIDDPSGGGVVTEAGIIYAGTSNWGWMKFLKATMGTFQFIDGPYRLIMMTIPSSLMQQYVPSRYCKYQYPDGTYIVQVGTEDMCYVMIERFTTKKNEQMFNAIEYTLVLRRVIPLGSSP